MGYRERDVRAVLKDVWPRTSEAPLPERYRSAIIELTNRGLAGTA
jgi:hypothetical protein